MIKRSLILLATLLLISAPLEAQKHGRGGEIPVYKEISGFNEVKEVLPQASELVKANEVWHKIVDKGGAVIGYCMSSKPYSDGIEGYHGTTPVIIILDKEKRIKKITLLSHYETQAYVNILKQKKFFSSWEGKTIKEAMNSKASADSYSGATITATAIRRNIDILLRKANENKI
ncbi:MAG: hypothetical protein BGO30_03465 [Bacteroidetes bacterium 41-46]|nr:MAG: hypothetical protein BGO30_03465 [Bacteroidetes bacterium 41-46]